MRRGGRRAAGNRLGDVARQRLQEAKEHYREGRYAEAAALFERMASVARERGMPRVATHLGARAAASHAQLGQAEAFDQWLEHAVVDAKQDGDPDRSARTFGQLLQVIEGTPLADRADAVRDTVRSQVGVTPRVPESDDTPINRSVRRHLPAKCGSCGAPVDANEVMFNDDGSVDCPTCGGLVNG